MLDFKAIGKRIKKLRENNGYTQEVFAETLDISIEHLSRIETGACRPSLGLIEKIGTALGADEQKILFGSPSECGITRELYDKIDCLPKDKKQALFMIIELITK
ncbi:MAG: helix-turn-helix transcriptional regulator [Clostridia bacterium]|nr:helix-turn-helix transcriptional regulator [Clostridia bacterium]